MVATATASSVYGRDGYSQCAYQEDCPVAPDSGSSSDESILPSKPQTPAPANTNPAWEITTNIVEDSVIDRTKLDVTARLDQTIDGITTPVPLDQIGWVILYVDDVRIAVQYSPDKDGQFHLIWDVAKYPGTKINIVFYNKSGEAMERKDMSVRLGPILPGGTAKPPTSAGGGSGSDKIILSPFFRKFFETFPYWLFLVLLAITLRMLWQTIREIKASERLREIINRQRHIYQTKQTFLSLVSHYLRTPLSVISGGVELVATGLQARPDVLNKLQTSVADLANKINMLIMGLEQNEHTSAITDPARNAPDTTRSIRTASFWTLIGGIILLCAIAEMLLISLTNINLDYIDILIQVVLDVAVAVFLLLSIRQSHLKRTQRQQLDQTLAYEANLDSARNQFVYDAATMLHAGTNTIESVIHSLPGQKHIELIQRGTDALDDFVRKFEIAATISKSPAAADEHTAVPLVKLTRQILAAKQPAITAKQLSVTVPQTEFQAVNNTRLLHFVIAALIDNAIKFSQENGSIAISAEEQPGVIIFNIDDKGIGIPAEAMQDIFEPFGRGTSVQDYNYEGAGLSLFLCKLIMEHLGGSIDLQSDNQGTHVSLRIPMQF